MEVEVENNSNFRYSEEIKDDLEGLHNYDNCVQFIASMIQKGKCKRVFPNDNNPIKSYVYLTQHNNLLLIEMYVGRNHVSYPKFPMISTFSNSHERNTYLKLFFPDYNSNSRH